MEAVWLYSYCVVVCCILAGCCFWSGLHVGNDVIRAFVYRSVFANFKLFAGIC